MKLEKRDGALLLAIGIWNIVIWSNFAKNLAKTRRSGEHRPPAYFIAHGVLIAVDSVIGGFLTVMGLKVLRRS